MDMFLLTRSRELPWLTLTASSMKIVFRLLTSSPFAVMERWLHGDSRGSVDRFHNRYGTPLIAPNRRWEQYNERTLKRPPSKLTARRRAAVDAAIREMCKIRKWNLWALDTRTNHVHTVVTANCDPEIVLNAFKANATRKMREAVAGKAAELLGSERAAKDGFGLRKLS